MRRAGFPRQFIDSKMQKYVNVVLPDNARKISFFLALEAGISAAFWKKTFCNTKILINFFILNMALRVYYFN